MAVDGMGEDKLEDIIHSLAVPAAKAFQESMYDNSVIFRENWPLEFFHLQFEDAEEFDAIFQDQAKYRLEVGKLIEHACKEKEVSEEDCKAMLDGINTAYIDQYNNTAAENPAYAFAQFFYRIDLGNFFFFESGIPETLKYFSYHPGHPWEMELRLFKGVHSRLIKGGITPSDIATVINYPEQVITLWTTALFD